MLSWLSLESCYDRNLWYRLIVFATTQKGVIMSLKEKLEDWVKFKEWDDEVGIDEDGDSSLAFTADIDGQTFKVFFEGDETRNWLKFFLYAPFNARAEKFEEMLKLVNHIHGSTYYGRLMIDADSGVIQYKQIVCIADAEITNLFIENIFQTGVAIYSTWLDELAAVALTKKTFEQLKQEWDAESSSTEAPDNL